MGGPGLPPVEPNTNYVTVFTPEDGARPGRVPPDGLPVQAADAAGRHVRRVRLPRRDGRPSRAGRRLDHAAAGAEPAQRRFMLDQAEPLRGAAAKRGRRTTRPAQVRRAFRLAFRRDPSPTRGARRPRRLVRDAGLADLLPGAASTPTSSCHAGREPMTPVCRHAGRAPARPPRTSSATSTGLGGIALAIAARGSLCRGRRPIRPTRRCAAAPHFAAEGEARARTSSAPGRAATSTPGTTSPSWSSAHGQPMPGRRTSSSPSRARTATWPEPLGVPAARPERQDASPTCCRTWPSWPTRCASSTR